MSLLNQVLQDLQERQAPDVNAAQATLRDVRIPLRSAPRVARRPWVLWLAILVLAGVSGSLLWQRSQQGAATSVAMRRTAAASPAAIPRPAQQLAATGANTAAPDASTEPARTPATVTAPAVSPVAAQNTHAVAPAALQKSIQSAQVLVPTVDAHTPSADAVAATPTPAPVETKKVASSSATVVSRPATTQHSGAVEKTARPLSPEQQAELTYQDALRLLQSGRPSAAEPRLRAALDEYPAHRAARTALAGMLINAGRLPEATSLLGTGLASAPTYAPFAKLYARLRIDQGELADARAVLERAAPAAQDDPEYHALLAALYQRLGLYEQAAQTYRGALQAQPRNGVWWLGLGLALEAAGDNGNALQAYLRAQQSGTLDNEVQRYVDGKLTNLQSGNGDRR